MPHNPALDGLRGAGALLVMCAHYYGLFGLYSGMLGVNIFFVLSGFLITSLLMKEIEDTGTIRIGNFIVRRILRLVPALVAMVMIYGIFDLVIGIRPPDLVIKAMLTSLAMYASNWVRALDLWNMVEFGHTWSLAIEDQFYLVWPLVLLFLARAGRITAIIVVLIGVVALQSNRYAALISGNVPIGYIDAATHYQMDALLIGAIPAFLVHYNINRTALLYAAAAACAVLTAIAIDPRNYMFKQPAVVMSVSIILLHLRLNKDSFIHRALSVKWLTYSGKISYGLYLYHYPMWFLTVHNYGQDWDTRYKQIICLFILTPITFFMSWASYKYLEEPFLRLKKHFRNERAAPVTGFAPAQP